jgi:Xaa-Pro aminopeptidase
MIEKRIEKIRQLISIKRIDALMVLVEENRHYLSGFTGEDHQFDESAGALLISKDGLILATDSRFEIQANNESPLYDVVVYKKGLAKALPELANQLNIGTLGFEMVRVSIKQYEAYQKALEATSSKLKLVPVEDMVEGIAFDQVLRGS